MPAGQTCTRQPLLTQFAVGLFVESACHKTSRVFALDDSFTFHQTMMLTSSEAALKYGPLRGRTISLEFSKAKPSDGARPGHGTEAPRQACT